MVSVKAIYFIIWLNLLKMNFFDV